jgi:hypothetical protein
MDVTKDTQNHPNSLEFIRTKLQILINQIRVKFCYNDRIFVLKKQSQISVIRVDPKNFPNYREFVSRIAQKSYDFE